MQPSGACQRFQTKALFCARGACSTENGGSLYAWGPRSTKKAPLCKGAVAKHLPLKGSPQQRGLPQRGWGIVMLSFSRIFKSAIWCRQSLRVLLRKTHLPLLGGAFNLWKPAVICLFLLREDFVFNCCALLIFG